MKIIISLFLSLVNSFSNVDSDKAVNIANNENNKIGSSYIIVDGYEYNWTTKYDKYFKEAGNKYNVDWKLLKAICVIESDFDIYSKSSAGCIGLMQVHPVHWQGCSYEPKQNILKGAQIYDWGRKTIENVSPITKSNKEALRKYALLVYNHGISFYHKKHWPNYAYYTRTMKIYNYITTIS